MIEDHSLGRDPLKRLAVTKRDRLQQHATLGVDLQRVALGAATERIQLKHASPVSPI